MKGSKRHPSLEELRRAIDAIDDELLALIEKRAQLAAQVGEYKQSNTSAPFYVPSREAEIIRRLLKKNRGLIPEESLHAIFREIIGACLALESPLAIAYLGPEGTFTHVASRRQFGAQSRYAPCRSLDEVFDEVESGRAAYGVVPVENAFEGAVTHTLDLLVDSHVRICAEILLGIHHHLIGTCSDLERIEVVYSHPQALAQCRRWLAAHLPGARLLETESTARAVNIVAEHGGKAGKGAACAAIASLEAAEAAGLPVLVSNIEDHHDNITRFLVIGRHDSPPSGRDKTALVMSARDRPGALHDLLTPFQRRGIGLTRIESRPSRKKLWEYVFFVDIQGHRQDEDVAAALEEIQALPDSFLKILGSYPVAERL